jgi:hypothetical protein
VSGGAVASAVCEWRMPRACVRRAAQRCPAPGARVAGAHSCSPAMDTASLVNSLVVKSGARCVAAAAAADTDARVTGVLAERATALPRPAALRAARRASDTHAAGAQVRASRQAAGTPRRQAGNGEMWLLHPAASCAAPRGRKQTQPRHCVRRAGGGGVPLRRSEVARRERHAPDGGSRLGGRARHASRRRRRLGRSLLHQRVHSALRERKKGRSAAGVQGLYMAPIYPIYGI